MAASKIRGNTQILAGSITNTECAFGTPVATGDVAIKSYVDGVAQGLSAKPSAAAGTTAALPANTYTNNVLTASANGVLTVDDYAVALNDYILVKDEVSGLKNGLYRVTTLGTASVPYVLTRAIEMDVSSEFTGAFVFIEQGTVNASSGWTQTAIAPTVGTTSINFVQFSGAGQVTAGNGITKTGNSLSIDTSITVDKNTAQTLTNKTLTSPVINTPTGIVKGDVGLGNADNTSDVNKPVSTAQQNALNLKGNITSQTFVTPNIGVASGTSLQLSAATPLILVNGQNVNVAVTSQTTGATTLTIPDFAGVVDTFVFATKAATLSNKTFVAPALGTPASGVATNLTGTASGLTAGNVTTNANLTGDVTSSGNATTIAVYARSTAVTGTQDGSNKIFTIANAVKTGSEQIYINGQLLNPGAANDYVISGTTVTLQAAISAPSSADVLRAYGVY